VQVLKRFYEEYEQPEVEAAIVASLRRSGR
jgi:hypothetical protein